MLQYAEGTVLIESVVWISVMFAVCNLILHAIHKVGWVLI